MDNDKRTIFDDYDAHGQCQLSPSLLWDQDLSTFDWHRGRGLVVQRVIERGRLHDYFAAFQMYGGIDGFRQIIRDEVPYLSHRDLNFVSKQFEIPKKDIKCYTRTLSRRRRFNS